MLKNLLFISLAIFMISCAGNSSKTGRMGSDIKAGDRIITSADLGPSGSYILALVREIDVEKDSVKLSYIRNDGTISDDTKVFSIDQIYPLAFEKDCGATTLSESRLVVYQVSTTPSNAPAVYSYLGGQEENGKIKFDGARSANGNLLTEKEKEKWIPPAKWCNVTKLTDTVKD